MKNRKILYSLIIILSFFLAFYGKQILTHFIELPITNYNTRIAYSYFWWLIPSILSLVFLFGILKIPAIIGLRGSITIGVIFSAITVSPMFVSSAFLGAINENLAINELIHKTILAGFMEEYLFRGFLFGILYRKLGWGFIPAALLGGLIFGLGHIYQGASLIETTSIFLITSMGAVWFSWLYIEWDNNLWVPIFLHIFMNLSWILFEVSNDALGGLYTNLFRVITIASTIIITIYYHKKEGLKIRRNNLLQNKIF